MNCHLFLFVFSCFAFMTGFIDAAPFISLRENLQKANSGDYIVTSYNNNITLLHINDRNLNGQMTIEEISIPLERLPKRLIWKEWLAQGAPQSTSWILYTINLSTGVLQRCFSVTRNGWLDISQQDSFLPKLLNLYLVHIPYEERKKIGPKPISGPDFRNYWQPKMVVNGQRIPGVEFEGWTTVWPRDNSPLSGKTIEIYTPSDTTKYPSYFPYWLQIRGAFGKATIYIVDSGSNLVSPMKLPQ